MKVSESFENFTPEQLKVLKDNIDELIKNKESYEIVEKEENKDLLTAENWFIAVKEGDIDAVKVFIKHRFDVNVKDLQWGSTALMFASQKGKFDIVKLLVKNSAYINVKSNHGSTALMFAVKSNKYETVKILVESGADVNIKDDENISPIMATQNDGILKLLLENGANYNDINKTSNFYKLYIHKKIKELA